MPLYNPPGVDPAGSISLTEMADIATDKLIGRDTAGTGAPEALAVSGGVEFSGTGGIQRSALTGAVAAAAGSGATTFAATGAAYTQTYSTAARTHSNPTATTVVTTAAGLASYGYTEAQANAIVTAVNALVADVANTKQVLNAAIDDLQGIGASG